MLTAQSKYMTTDERTQVRKFEDAFNEIVDSYLKEGMDPGRMMEIFRFQTAGYLCERQEELEQQK